MLAQLGTVQIEVWPFNMTERSVDSAATFAEKPVMGRRPTLEFMGPGPETRVLTCKLFPAKFGGLSTLDAVYAQKDAGQPLPFMRGDGTPEGWFVIEKVNEKSSYLDRNGVGQVIEVEITLKRDDPPSAATIFSILGSMLG